MKKNTLPIMIIIVALLVNMNGVYATTNNSKILMDRSFLINVKESDGTIAIGCTVYNEDGSLYGTKPGDGIYLENIIPKKCLTVKELTRKENTKCEKVVLSDTGKKNLHYEPEDKNLVVRFSKNTMRANPDIDISVINAQTGKVIARGFNLKSEEDYVIAQNLERVPLVVEISSQSKSSPIEMKLYSAENLINSSGNRDISFNNDLAKVQSNSSLSDRGSKTYTTGLVPKNVNGQQGEIMFSHTIASTNNNVCPRTKYVSGSNDMKKVNFQILYGDTKPAVMNISVGKTVDWNFTIANGKTVDMKMSTNSNSGKAKVKMIDYVY